MPMYFLKTMKYSLILRIPRTIYWSLYCYIDLCCGLFILHLFLSRNDQVDLLRVCAVWNSAHMSQRSRNQKAPSTFRPVSPSCTVDRRQTKSCQPMPTGEIQYVSRTQYTRRKIPYSTHHLLAITPLRRLGLLTIASNPFNTRHHPRHHYVHLGHHIGFHSLQHHAHHLRIVGHQGYCCWYLPRSQRLTRPHLGPRLHQ